MAQTPRQTERSARSARGLRTLALSLLARLVPEEAGAPEGREELAALARFRIPEPGEGWPAYLATSCRSLARPDHGLARIVRAWRLSAEELLATTLALAVEDDVMVGRGVARLQSPLGGSRPTLGLLAAALAPLAPKGAPDPAVRAMHRIASGTAVRRGLLVTCDAGAPLPEQSLRIPLPLAMALVGAPAEWPGATRAGDSQSGGPTPTLDAAAQAHGASLAAEGGRALVLRGTSGSDARGIAEVIARASGRSALFLDGEQVETVGLGAFCMLSGLLPVYEYPRLAPADHRVLPAVPGYDGPVLVIAGAEGAFQLPGGTVMSWDVPVPPHEERRALWNRHLGAGELADTLAREHLHRPARVRELALLAARRVQVEGRDTPTREDLRWAACNSEGGHLGALAQPVPESVPDEALVRTEPLARELDLLLERCRRREDLARGMGVTLTARYRVGVRSLLTGPSGTGKTLAAGWLATRLGLPLYRVDLAAVTSKYIGETEKNLAELLSRAESDEVVLLFDEADSMFGKRTDIKDANDRFANAQTNYLLQRIESYTGIVLMTSNSRARFDAAFTRRIDTVVEFPLPGPEERRQLWRVHLGDGHGLGPRQINQLAATADIAGGHIRNVVLTAAVRARAESRTVAFGDVVLGLQLEYRKLGKKLPVELAREARAG